MSNDEIAKQHFEHFHPEFAPMPRHEHEQIVNELRKQIDELRKSIEMLERIVYGQNAH